MTHQRVYTTGLALLALFNVMLLVNGAMEMNLVGRGWEGSVWFIPSWAVPWVGLLLLGYTVAALSILFLRRRRPDHARGPTRAFNWLLLPAFPAGTMVGLYGLLKVDACKFDLEEAIAVWRRQVSPLGAPVAELERRLREETGDQMWSWKSANEERAFALAVERLKDPAAAAEISLPADSARRSSAQRTFGWLTGAVVFPALMLGFLVEFDQIALGAGEQAAVAIVVGLGVLLHFCTWRQLYRRLPIVSRRRALQTIQSGCVAASILCGLISLSILLPGLNFSGPVSVETATYLKSTIPSIPLWCVCYLAGMSCLTLCCGLEEAALQADQSSKGQAKVAS